MSGLGMLCIAGFGVVWTSCIPTAQDLIGAREAVASVDHVDMKQVRANPLVQALVRTSPSVKTKLKNGEVVAVPDVVRFFARGGRKRVLPEFNRLVHDTELSDRHRSQALHALYLLDNDLGKEAAKKSLKASGQLGAIARDIDSGTLNWSSRSTLLASILKG